MQFDERVEACSQGLQEKLESLKTTLDLQLEDTHMEIKSTITQMEVNICSTLKAVGSSLFEKATKARDEKISEIERIFNKGAQCGLKFADSQTELETLSKKSVLNYGLEDMSRLFSLVSERDSEILSLEKLRSEQLAGKIAFKCGESVEKNITNLINQLCDIGFKWQSFDDLKSENVNT